MQAQESSDSLAKATDFTIPASPAFTLLGANPSLVTRPAFTKDFRLDWVLKGGNLVSDIAIDAQPIWILFYKDVSLPEYRRKDEINRILSTLSVSIGTAKRDSIRSLAWALKLNVYRSVDPMLDTAYINVISPRYSTREKNLRLRLAGVEDALEDEEFSETQKDSLRELNERIHSELAQIRISDIEKLSEIESEYTRSHWNASLVDVAFGRLYDYESASIDSLAFVSTGFGVWINGALGVGQTWLISALLRYGETGGRPSRLAGANIRYGDGARNFFVEYVHENIGGVNTQTISYGGEFKASDDLAIQFSLRTGYDRKFNLGRILPLVNLNWRLRGGMF
jgi:hypothetical protein